MLLITSSCGKMIRLVAFYENVQEAYGSEPEYGYTDFDRQKPYIYTHDLFFRMQRVCLVSRTPFSQRHVKVFSLDTLVPLQARPKFSSTVVVILTLTGVLYTS